jgi:RND family efflux transporter MFP subunit
MKKSLRTAVLAAVIIAGLGGAAWVGAHFGSSAVASAKDSAADDAGASTEPTTEPVATVKTAAARLGEISETLTAYGTVTTQPGDISVFSVPFECRVSKVRVTGGQSVEKNIPLLEVEPSPDAKLQLQEANNNLQSATKDLAQTKQRFDLKLATNADLLTSQQAADLAQLRLTSLQQRGAAENHRLILASGSGLVSKVDVQEGQIVPAGGPLVETVARDQIQVRLGVEPSDVSRLHVGQAVRLFAVNSSSSSGVTGKIHLITQRVNPDTRLVDVFVTPDQRDAMMLEGYVKAELSAGTARGLVVPREAVLPDDQGYSLFTVKDGHAVEHHVKVGLENDKEIEVIGSDVAKDDAVVVVGNYELENGMPVSAARAEPVQ